MEDTNDKRHNEIVKMPETEEEAHRMLEQSEKFLKNLRISSQFMSGNHELGFEFSP